MKNDNLFYKLMNVEGGYQPLVISKEAFDRLPYRFQKDIIQQDIRLKVKQNHPDHVMWGCDSVGAPYKWARATKDHDWTTVQGLEWQLDPPDMLNALSSSLDTASKVFSWIKDKSKKLIEED